MSQSTLTSSKQPSTEPLKLTASAVNYLLDDTTEGDCLLYRYRVSSDDDWAIGSIPFFDFYKILASLFFTLFPLFSSISSYIYL